MLLEFSIPFPFPLLPPFSMKICFFHFMLSYFLIRNNERSKSNNNSSSTRRETRKKEKNVKRSVMFHGWDENYIYISMTFVVLILRRMFIEMMVTGQRIELRKQNVFL